MVKKLVIKIIIENYNRNCFVLSFIILSQKFIATFEIGIDLLSVVFHNYLGKKNIFFSIFLVCNTYLSYSELSETWSSAFIGSMFSRTSLTPKINFDVKCASMKYCKKKTYKTLRLIKQSPACFYTKGKCSKFVSSCFCLPKEYFLLHSKLNFFMLRCNHHSRLV